MDKIDQVKKITKNQVIFIMGMIIILLVGFFAVPAGLENFQNRYREEGCDVCINKIANQIVNDLNTLGYTEIIIGEQRIFLGPVNVEGK